MNCQLIHPALSDYLDNGLPTEEARAVKSHLDGCSPCRRVFEDLDNLRLSARELPLRSPNAELWNRIRAGVAQEIDDYGLEPAPALPQSWWRRVLDRRISFNIPQLAGASALALALIASGIYYTSGALSPDGTSRVEKISAALVPEEPALKQQIEKQIFEVNQRKASWDPEVRAGFESHLARIDLSLETCRRSLERNAQDRDHQQMYLSLYQEKLRLLEDVNRLKW